MAIKDGDDFSPYSTMVRSQGRSLSPRRVRSLYALPDAMGSERTRNEGTGVAIKIVEIQMDDVDLNEKRVK